MKTLYFDCASGISGDMTVAALLDIGGDPEVLKRGLDSLGLTGYSLEIGRVSKNGIDACDFNVLVDNCAHAHEHDNDHAHEHEHEHGHSHDHAHGHEHQHEHSHAHQHRSFADIREIIQGSGITEGAKEYALGIFRVVAEAEAKIHAKPVDEVHFHEVGALDSIVDIVSVAILLDDMRVERLLCSPLSEGQGTILCRHGRIPIPAPATLEICRAYSIPLRITENRGELVTPTGAAIVAALAESFAPPGEFSVTAVGYGAGKRDYPHTANLLRVLVIEDDTPCRDALEAVCELSCNLDDISGELLAFACEELMRRGALDVWLTPATMKKGRPGHVLGLLCDPGREDEFSLLLMRHTSTIGVRSVIKRRKVMNRRSMTVQTPFGPVGLKHSALEGISKIKVEFESAKALSAEQGVPVDRILSAAYLAASHTLEENLQD